MSIDLHLWTRIYHSLPLTRYLVCCCCHWSSVFESFSDIRNFSLHLHSTTDRPLIDPQVTWYSDVNFQLIFISDPRSIASYHWPVPWSAVVVTGLLLSNIPRIFEKSVHLHSPIDRPPINPQLPWSSDVDCWLIRIADPIYITPTYPVPWSPWSPRYYAVDCRESIQDHCY